MERNIDHDPRPEDGPVADRFIAFVTNMTEQSHDGRVQVELLVPRKKLSAQSSGSVPADHCRVTFEDGSEGQKISIVNYDHNHNEDYIYEYRRGTERHFWKRIVSLDYTTHLQAPLASHVEELLDRLEQSVPF